MGKVRLHVVVGPLASHQAVLIARVHADPRCGVPELCIRNILLRSTNLGKEDLPDLLRDQRAGLGWQCHHICHDWLVVLMLRIWRGCAGDVVVMRFVQIKDGEEEERHAKGYGVSRPAPYGRERIPLQLFQHVHPKHPQLGSRGPNLLDVNVADLKPNKTI